MKNKDKYDLRVLDFKVNYLISGCGKKVDSSRTISVLLENKEIYKEKTQKELKLFVLEWLESEEKPLK